MAFMIECFHISCGKVIFFLSALFFMDCDHRFEMYALDALYTLMGWCTVGSKYDRK